MIFFVWFCLCFIFLDLECLSCSFKLKITNELILTCGYETKRLKRNDSVNICFTFLFTKFLFAIVQFSFQNAFWSLQKTEERKKHGSKSYLIIFSYNAVMISSNMVQIKCISLISFLIYCKTDTYILRIFMFRFSVGELLWSLPSKSLLCIFISNKFKSFYFLAIKFSFETVLEFP